MSVTLRRTEWRASGRTRKLRPSRPVRSPPPKKREREIVDAAAEIFHRNGYADTSVQDVADAVGILKGSLYYYIDSKEDLLYRVLLEVHEDAGDILASIVAMTGATPLERIAAYVRSHVEYNVRNTPRSRSTTTTSGCSRRSARRTSASIAAFTRSSWRT